MSKYNMPKNRKQFEDMLVNAFEMGITCGYGVEHEDLSNDENVFKNRFRAYIQGKISSMNECIDGEKTYLERVLDEVE